MFHVKHPLMKYDLMNVAARQPHLGMSKAASAAWKMKWIIFYA